MTDAQFILLLVALLWLMHLHRQARRREDVRKLLGSLDSPKPRQVD